MGKFFPQKDPFQDSEITFPLACKLPTEKVLTDFTCFSWEVAFTRGLQPSSWGLRAQALLAWSHGCAFPAASASEKQKWQTWSGQCSHQMWILPAEKLNHLIKTSLSKLHFLLEKKNKITQTNSGKNMCIKTMSINHQCPMASHDAIVPDRAICLPPLNARFCKSSHQINYQGRKRGKEAEAVWRQLGRTYCTLSYKTISLTKIIFFQPHYLY